MNVMSDFIGRAVRNRNVAKMQNENLFPAGFEPQSYMYTEPLNGCLQNLVGIKHS